MRVLFLTHNDGMYGACRSLLNLLDGLRDYDVSPHVVTLKKGVFTEELEARGIPYRILPVIWWVEKWPVSIRRMGRIMLNLSRSILAIDRVVRDWKIEAVCSNSSVYPAGRIVSFKNGIPHVWYLREFVGRGDSRFVSTWALSLALIRSSAAVICNSSAVKNFYFRSGGGERVHVVYNGIASRARFDALAEQEPRAKRNEVYTFLMVGAIDDRKGHESAIEALSCLDKLGIHARMVVAGSGPESCVHQCKQLAEELGVTGSVDFVGYLADPYEVYLKSDCLLMCSVREPAGRVTVEAMSAGLPVIGRNSGGTPELVEHGRTGFLYDTQDELVARMRQLVEDPEQGRRLGAEGWRVAKERFSNEVCASSIYGILASTLRRRASDRKPRTRNGRSGTANPGHSVDSAPTLCQVEARAEARVNVNRAVLSLPSSSISMRAFQDVAP